MRTTWLIVLGVAAACGGKVASQGDSGSTGAGGGTTGTSATMSSAASTAFAATSTDGTTTTAAASGTGGVTFGTGGNGGTLGTGAGGAIPPDDPLCAMFCARAAATCPSGISPMCTSECSAIRVTHPICNSPLDSFLKCGLTTPLLCSPTNQVDWPSCTTMANDLTNCLNPPPPPPPIDAGVVPVCGTAPRPGPMVCSGGGSSGASSTSTGGPASCMNQCTDSNHNTWISDCVGNNCSCWFNGTQYCHCTLGTRSCFEGGCCPM